MEPTREMKLQFSPEELERLSSSEEAFLSEMDLSAGPTREMQKVFSAEELAELSAKEDAYLADQELAELASSRQRTPAQIKQAAIARARQTAEADAARKSAKGGSTINVGRPLKSQAEVNREAAIARGRAPKNKTGITAGKPVPQKATQTQAQINLEAAKARGRAAGPVDEAAEYALKDAAGYFNDDYFSAINEMAYADDIISETFEVLDAPVAAIASSGKAVASSSAAAVSSAVTKGAPTATRASATLSSAVSKGGKNAHLNLKTAAAAAALGLAGGYVANRKRTRR